MTVTSKRIIKAAADECSDNSRSFFLLSGGSMEESRNILLAGLINARK